MVKTTLIDSINWTTLIYIIIPVHNRKNFTRDCLLSLRKQTFKKYSTIVVDDGSSDGTIEMIKKNFPEVVLLRGDGNLWWTGAINIGVKYVLENATPEDHILTLNDDSVVNSDYLETLIECAFKNPKSLVGSIALNDEEAGIVEDGGVKINWSTAKFNFLSRGLEYKVIMNRGPFIIPVDVLSGRGTLIPVKVFQNIGLYDSINLPHYGADYEFSYRAKRKGYNLFVNYKSVVMNKVCSIDIKIEGQLFKFIEFFKKFFSKRSALCIRYRWKFARLTCPKTLLPSFFILDVGRMIVGFVRDQLRHKISFHRDVR